MAWELLLKKIVVSKKGYIKMSKFNTKASTGTLLTGIALLASTPAYAELIVTEHNVLINDGFQYEFDVNGDDVNDFIIRVGSDDINPLIETRSVLEADVLPGLDATKQFPGSAAISALGEGREIFRSQSKLKGESNFVFAFGSGDDVDGTVGSLSKSGDLYRTAFAVENVRVALENDVVEGGSKQVGPFATEGTRGFIGFALTEFTDLIDMKVLDETDDELMEKLPSVTNYGWIEIVRGSVNVVRVGFQTTANTAAAIPGAIAVSEPATLPLIALGAAGLVALRRRKAAK